MYKAASLRSRISGKTKGKTHAFISQTGHIPHLFLDTSSLQAGIQKQDRVYLNNQAFRGVFLVLAFISHRAPLFTIMLKPPSWPLPASLLSSPTASEPPLPQPCHSLCTILNTCPAPSCSLWKPICAVKLPTYKDHPLLSGSHSLLVFSRFKSVDFSGVAAPLCSFPQESEPLHLAGLFKDKVFLGNKRLLLFAQQN